MEKFAVWFYLLLKKNIKKRTTYIQSIILVILLLFVQIIHIPNADNVKVGICFNDSTYAEDIYSNLEEQTEVYEFIEYKDKITLEKDVTSGIIECGFSFSKDFDDDFEDGNIRNVVLFLTTPMSAKGELIQENFYIAFLKSYSQVILTHSENELYESSSEERVQQILKANESYLIGDELFDVEVKMVDTKPIEEVGTTQTYLVQGVFGIFIFLFMFFSHTGNTKNDANNFRAILNKKEGFLYDILDSIAAGIIPTVLGLIVVIFSANSRGVLSEILGAILLLILNAIWVVLFSSICKNELNYLSAVLVIVFLQLLVCPVFWDLSSYFTYLKYFRYLFPLGFYLSL